MINKLDTSGLRNSVLNKKINEIIDWINSQETGSYAFAKKSELRPDINFNKGVGEMNDWVKSMMLIIGLIFTIWGLIISDAVKTFGGIALLVYGALIK